MAFTVFRRGAILRDRSVGQILRARWSTLAESRDREIERRQARGIPLDDMAPLGDYDGDEQLDKISVDIEVVPRGEYIEIEARWIAGEDAAIADLVRQSVRGVRGLADESGASADIAGALDDGAVALLEDSGLAQPLFLVAMWLHTIMGEARKNCGASQPSTSVGGTAARVLSPTESNGAATVAVSSSIFPAPSTAHAPAQSEPS